MADSRLEDQNKPGPDLKGLWLLPVLALGFGTLLLLRKPMTLTADAEAAQTAKSEAYRAAEYCVMNQITRDHPEWLTRLSIAPYNYGTVTSLGRGRFLCSGSVQTRFHPGAPLWEQWQCIVVENSGNWTCENFRHKLPERTAPAHAGLAESNKGNDKTGR